MVEKNKSEKGQMSSIFKCSGSVGRVLRTKYSEARGTMGKQRGRGVNHFKIQPKKRKRKKKYFEIRGDEKGTRGKIGQEKNHNEKSCKER